MRPVPQIKILLTMARKFENFRNDKRNGNQFSYLLDSIYNPETGENYNNDADAIRAAWAQFCEEYNHAYNIRLYPNLSQRVGSWFQGLPSGINIAFTYADIIATGQTWGYCQTEKKAERFCENWFQMLGLRFVQLAQALGLC